MKIVITTLFSLFLSINFLNAEKTKQMTDEEFMKIIMQQEEESKELNDKSKALDKLEESVDKLSDTLKVDK